MHLHIYTHKNTHHTGIELTACKHCPRSLFVPSYAYIHGYTQTHIHIHIHTYIYMNTSTCTYTHEYILSTCMHTLTELTARIHRARALFAASYTYTHTHTHTRVHTHTHIGIHIRTNKYKIDRAHIVNSVCLHSHCLSAFVYVCMYRQLHTYIHTYVCMCSCTYLWLYRQLPTYVLCQFSMCRYICM